MKKRKINPEYLRMITGMDVRESDIDAESLALTLREFANGYLGGLISLSIEGHAIGTVNLNLPVLSYFVRLLCEDAEDEPVECSVTLGDDIIIKVTNYPMIASIYSTAHLLDIAKFVGFKVQRIGNTLIFKAAVRTSTVMKVYANTIDELMHWLITTYNM